MLTIFKSLWKYLLFAIIVLIVRSSILMFITGFSLGIITYHFYPQESGNKLNQLIILVEKSMGVDSKLISTLKLPHDPKAGGEMKDN